MTRLGLLLGSFALCVLTLCKPGFGQDEPKPAETTPAAPSGAAAQPAPDAGATHKVKREPFKIEVEMSGVFEAPKAWPVAINPHVWSSFTVLKAVEHGKPVQKGETLVWLDMKEIDEQIQDLEKTIRLNQLALQLADFELESAKTTLALDLEASARAKKIADEDLLYFLNINKAYLIESANFSLKSARQSLEYSEEELRQLEKMYQADDLTEETEEIVLKRARNEVEQSKFYLQGAEQRTKRTLEQDIPRQEQQMTDAAHRADIALTKTRVTLPLSLEKQQIEREKLRLDHQRAEKKLQELIADRKSMAVESPMDGYVYYGRATRGKWPGVDTMASQLQEGGKLTPNNAFMTVVSPRPLRVRADVAEKDLYRLAKGLSGTATPVGYPDMKLPITVEHVSPFPIGPGTFDGYVRVELDDRVHRPVVPGMSCKLVVTAYETKDALTLPAAAVFEDPADGQQNLVYVKTGADTSQPRKVVVGQKSEQVWEIVQGLNPGDEILLKKPE